MKVMHKGSSVFTHLSALPAVRLLVETFTSLPTCKTRCFIAVVQSSFLLPSSSQSEYFKLHVSFSCLQSLSCVLQQWRTFLTLLFLLLLLVILKCCQIITLDSLYCCKTKHANGPFIMPLTTSGHNFIKQCHTLYDISFCITFWIAVEDDSVKINK